MADTGVSEPESTDLPNVLLVMTDDQGWGDVSYNDHPHIQTPEMDQMAEEGVRFDRFYSAAPVCSPTRGSCLTGRHPYRYGIVHANEGHLPEEELTLAEILQSRGYRTGHFGKWHLGTMTEIVRDGNRGGITGSQHYAPPWEHGFDECFSTESSVPTWDPMETPPIAVEDDQVEADRLGDSYGSYYWTGPGQTATDNLQGNDSRIIVDRAESFIRGAVQNDRPFFGVVWFHAPHTPIVAGEDYRERYSDRPDGEQHYYGTITAIDDQISRLRETLDELGVADNTMLWFASDNGPSGFDSARTQGTTGGLRGRKDSLYEGGIRVPGTLVWPDGIDQSTTVEAPCVTSDYLPTVLDAVGIEGPSHSRPVDGMSVLPLIEGDTHRRPEPIGFQHPESSAAWIDNEYKIIRPGEGEAVQLYNLEEDPGETTDIAGEQPERVSTMRTALEEWRESCSRSRAGDDYP